MVGRDKMGRLAIVGLGLHDESGISIEGMREIREAEVVFAEEYTSALAEGSLERLSQTAGKRIDRVDRRAVEDATVILEASESSKVVLLVAGDPMTATTHIDLRLRAAEKRIPTVVVHGASALTAVPGVLGLQHYKFGRTTSLPFPQEGYSPTSPYDVIRENFTRGLHTLVLLDIDAENSRYMTASEGLHLLLDMERRIGGGVIAGSTLACVVARAGYPDCKAAAGTIDDLMTMSFGGPPHAMVLPGKLHFMEEEALRVFAGYSHASER